MQSHSLHSFVVFVVVSFCLFVQYKDQYVAYVNVAVHVHDIAFTFVLIQISFEFVIFSPPSLSYSLSQYEASLSSTDTVSFAIWGKLHLRGYLRRCFCCRCNLQNQNSLRKSNDSISVGWSCFSLLDSRLNWNQVKTKNMKIQENWMKSFFFPKFQNHFGGLKQHFMFSLEKIKKKNFG